MTAIASDELPSSLAGLPEAAARHLALAGSAYCQDSIAERHLAEASRIAPDHLAVLVGQYRYLFYKGRLAEALAQLRVCMAAAAEQGSLPADWRTARASDAAFGDFGALWARFYMFALKAYGYIHLRLGLQEEGRHALQKVMELDPTDKVGAKVLLDVLDRQGRDDYDDE